MLTAVALMMAPMMRTKVAVRRRRGSRQRWRRAAPMGKPTMVEMDPTPVMTPYMSWASRSAAMIGRMSWVR